MRALERKITDNPVADELVMQFIESAVDYAERNIDHYETAHQAALHFLACCCANLTREKCEPEGGCHD